MSSELGEGTLLDFVEDLDHTLPQLSFVSLNFMSRSFLEISPRGLNQAQHSNARTIINFTPKIASDKEPNTGFWGLYINCHFALPKQSNVGKPMTRKYSEIRCV